MSCEAMKQGNLTCRLFWIYYIL